MEHRTKKQETLQWRISLRSTFNPLLN